MLYGNGISFIFSCDVCILLEKPHLRLILSVSHLSPHTIRSHEHVDDFGCRNHIWRTHFCVQHAAAAEAKTQITVRCNCTGFIRTLIHHTNLRPHKFPLRRYECHITTLSYASKMLVDGISSDHQCDTYLMVYFKCVIVFDFQRSATTFSSSTHTP